MKPSMLAKLDQLANRLVELDELLSARDIKSFKRDGESWVRFYLAIDDAHSHPIERQHRKLCPRITTQQRHRT